MCDQLKCHLDSILIIFVQIEAAQHLIKQMDVNNDGKVSFPEFLLVMKHGNPVAGPKTPDSCDVKMTEGNIINSDNNTYIHQQGTLKIQGL